MRVMCAEPKRPSVRMPACAPVSTTAGTPSPHSRPHRTTAAITSPQEAIRSRSLAGTCPTPASARSVSVAYGSPFLPMAETTTTTEWPASRSRMMCRSTCLRASSVASEVPPNFWTRSPICPLHAPCLQDDGKPLPPGTSGGTDMASRRRSTPIPSAATGKCVVRSLRHIGNAGLRTFADGAANRTRRVRQRQCSRHPARDRFSPAGPARCGDAAGRRKLPPPSGRLRSARNGTPSSPARNQCRKRSMSSGWICRPSSAASHVSSSRSIFATSEFGFCCGLS